MGLGQEPSAAHHCPVPAGSNQHHHGAQFHGNPCPLGCLFLTLLFPCRAGAPPLGSVPSTVLPFTVPPGCRVIPLSSLWPWILHVPETTHIPHFAKNGPMADAVWQAAWQASPCYFGAVWRDHGLTARLHSLHAKGAAGSRAPQAAWTKAALAMSPPVARQSLRPSLPCLRCTCTGSETAASAVEPAPKKRQ